MGRGRVGKELGSVSKEKKGMSMRKRVGVVGRGGGEIRVSVSGKGPEGGT